MINASIDIGGYFRRKKAEEQQKQRQEEFQREFKGTDFRTPEGQQKLFQLAGRFPEETKSVLETGKTLSDFFQTQQAQQRTQQGNNILRQTQHGPYARGFNQGPTAEEKIMQLGAIDTDRANKMADVRTKTQPDDPYKNLEVGYRTYVMATGEPVGLPSYRNYQRSVLEQRKAGAANVNTAVNLPEQPPQIGTIPQGFEAFKTEAGGWSMRPVSGGPADREIKEQEQKNKVNERLRRYKADMLTSTIDDALNQVDGWTTGFIGDIGSKVKGTKAYDLKNTISTIQANFSFDALEAMRAASPTGGALGQVSEVEIQLLMDSLTAINQGQSEEQVIKNLNKAKRHYENMKYLMRGEMPPEYTDDGKPVAQDKKPTTDPLGLFQ